MASPDTYSVPNSTDAVRRMLFELAKYSQGLEKELDSLRRTNPIESRSNITSTTSTPTTLPAEADAPLPRSEIDLDEALGDRLKGLTMNYYPGRHFGE